MIGDSEKAAPVGPAPDAPEDSIDREVEFYYSRERRLRRASREVRALNDGKAMRPGFSKSLFGSRSNVMVLLSILVICAMFAIASRLSAPRLSTRDRGVKFGGNTLSVSVLNEENTFALQVIKAAPKSGEAYTGAVDIAVSPVLPKPEAGEAPETPEIFTHRVVFHPVASERYYVSLPFEGDDFFVLLSSGEEQKTLRLGVK